MSLFSRNSDGVATLVALLVATACQEPQRTAGPAAVARPSLAISDGAHSGLGQFLWLPPMVPNPKDTGTFDPTVLPVVRICEWTGAACVGDPIATFTTTTGPNGETVALDLIDSLYQVDWHTDQFNLPLGSTYRVSVSSGPWLIGYADILMVGPGQVKNASNGNDVPMVDGKTLPIKFRVDRGLNPDFSMSQVSSGSGPACGVSPSGTAFCWGVNYYGALGNGTAALYNGVWSNTVQWLPTEVVGGLQFATIAAGFVSSCGLTTDGSAWCWGSNTTGQLGNGSNSDSKVPVAVSGGLRFVSITASQYSGDARDDKLGTACGVAIGGSLYCWGNNSFGQLGTGSYVSSNVPVPAAGGLTFASVSLGENHACGLTVTGAA